MMKPEKNSVGYFFDQAVTHLNGKVGIVSCDQHYGNKIGLIAAQKHSFLEELHELLKTAETLTFPTESILLIAKKK